MAYSTPSQTDWLPRIALALALAWLAIGAPVSAAPKKAPTGKAAAKKEAAEARRAFDLGRFDEALTHYEEAYRLLPVPALFFNIGQCHRQLGNDERAAYFFRRYLESNPPAGQAKATQALLDQVEASATAKKQKDAEAAEAARRMELEKARADTARAQAEAAEQQRIAEESARKAAEAQKAANRNAAVEKALTAPQVEKDVPVTKRWWFWTGVAAVVAAGVGTGVYVATAPTPLATTFPDINGR